MSDNVHAHEIQKFGSMAERWWDTQGEFKTLHAINPLRLQFIQQFTSIEAKRVLDVGCGGGILTEALAQKGARALGIDLSADLIDVAELHALETQTHTVDYQKISVEKLADEQPESFDFVTCMEMLEHVPDAGSVISACAKLVKPDGIFSFFSLPEGREGKNRYRGRIKKSAGVRIEIPLHDTSSSKCLSPETTT